MDTRQRARDDAGPVAGNTGVTGGAGLTRLRAAGQGFLAAGDAAINRALADHNSETFLNDTRQDGGQ